MRASPLAARDRRARRAILSFSFFHYHPGFLTILVLGGLFGSLLVVPIFLPGLLALFPDSIRTLFSAPDKAPINALIFWVTFMGGMATAALVLARIHREMLILAASQEKVEAAKEEWVKDSRLSWSLEDGLNAVLPTGAGAIEAPRESTAGRMVAAIQADAQDLRFDPIPIVVERVIADLDSGANAVRVWQGYAVRLGILFTFIGLVIALGPIRTILSATPPPGAGEAARILSWFAELRSSIGLVVNGLALAFGSSIVGLVSALLLQLVASMVQRREVDVIETLASVAADVQYVFRRARNETPLARDIEALKALLSQHKDELHASSRAINSDIAALDTRLDGIARARDSITVLLERQSQATEKQSTLVAELAGAEARVTDFVRENQGRLSDSLAKSQQMFEETLGKSVSQFTDSINKAFSEMGQSLTQEINEGYGREARIALEQRIATSLQQAIDVLSTRERNHAFAAEKVARNLARSFGIALLVLFAGVVAVLLTYLGYTP